MANRDEIRAILDQIAQVHRDRGELDQAARLELAREYFTNPQFRRALQDYSFARSMKE